MTDLFSEALESYQKIKKNGLDPLYATRGQISSLLKCDDRKARDIRDRVQIIAQMGEASGAFVPPAESPDGEEWEYRGSTASGSYVSLEKPESDSDIARQCGIDLDKWRIVRYKVKRYEQTMKPPATTIMIPRGDGVEVPMWMRESKKPVTTQMWSIQVSLELKSGEIFGKSEIEDLKRQWKAQAPKVKALKRSGPETGILAQLAIFDHHFGLLAHGEETGGANWDLKIACKCYSEAIDDMASRAGNVDKYLLVVGNDMFHTDSERGTTTKGTPQDTDSRYVKVFKKVRDLIVQKVLQLREKAPVDIVVVRGNHDDLTAWFFGDSLDMAFAGYDDITVDNAPEKRKYYEWGKCGLMFIHGDTGKKDRYPLTLAQQRPEMWGRTLYREVHLGHLHQTKTEEFLGVRVRIIPSLTPPSQWASNENFIGNTRASQCFLWSKDRGLRSILEHSVPQLWDGDE